jgi:lipopolysaccharide/colanic/teichoic acid biosynthesis glycosyltransferase
MVLLKIQKPCKRTADPTSDGLKDERVVLSDWEFERQLVYERKRCDRSQRSILLLLLEWRAFPSSHNGTDELSRIGSALAPTVRETDYIGWYRDHTTLGVIFTEVLTDKRHTIRDPISRRIASTLQKTVAAGQLDQVSISFHFFPDHWGGEDSGDGAYDPTLYPDTISLRRERRFGLAVKRCVDILFSSLLLLLCSPLFLLIAAAIRTTSKGPVFFVQQRVGQFGHPFTFLKFRSMEANNDCSPHRDFVNAFIAGNGSPVMGAHPSVGVYKLANDDRITAVGKLLRRASLDELPQLINVLCGQMSLVGPRPPLPYELDAYQTWHRRRLLDLKPGMTGLWQVKGRSHVRFDDMVRLDLRYAQTWSLWLDLVILLHTPTAVLKGAY